jgi:hypothetical protein
LPGPVASREDLPALAAARTALAEVARPMIVKYPFWAMTAENPNAVYACLNYDEAVCPEQIRSRSICIDGDSGEVLKALIRRDR